MGILGGIRGARVAE